jgi:hypothetical protein
MGQRHAHLITLLILQVETKPLTFTHVDWTLGESADAKFGTLQVKQNRERSSYLVLNASNQLVAPQMVSVAPMAEVQPKHIGTRIK